MIRLGYEIGRGTPVDVPLDHTAVTGRTQQSGKTTTLEAMVHRSGKRAVVFVTKKAESGFRDSIPIPPYFEDSGDWEFVSSILEAMMGERMKFERSWIIEACKGAAGLDAVYKNITTALHGVSETVRKGKKLKTVWKKKPATGLNAGMLTNLAAYLEKVLPQLHRLPYSDSLELHPGLNVMDLSAYSTELQSLVIRSVIKRVYEHESNTIVIIPEAWEFIPQNRRSPVLLAAEELIRKGAAAGNFVWLDSQDIAAVHKNVLRSVGVWILGVQREANEIKRMLNHIPAPRPNATDVMKLGRGQFFACFKAELHHVYVQPFWVGAVHAQAIARGTEQVESAERIWRERARDEKREHARTPGAFKAAEDAAHTVIRSAVDPPQQLQIQEQTPPEALGPYCMDCDGVGWVEGGAALQTTCKKCNGTGREPAPPVDADVPLCPDCEEALPCPEHGEDETMWKEKYEEAMQEIAGLRLQIAALTPSGAAPAAGITEPLPATRFRELMKDAEANWTGFLSQLRAHPEVIALIAERPTIRLSVERPVLEMNTSTLKGRLALLIHEGFFKAARSPGEVLAECKRRGWMKETNKTNHLSVYFADLNEMGFLVKEGAGYQAVPGMKIETEKG